jgi:hypothetical protein
LIGVSIIIPFIREDGLKRCIKAIEDSKPSVDYEIITEFDKDRIGAPKMVADLVSRSKFDMVCFVADDTIPQAGFLDKAVSEMENIPGGWGLVGLNDQTGRDLACHWLAHKNLLPLIGGEFFHTGYRHCFCDNELQSRAESLGRYVYAKDAVVVHDHPILQGKELSGDYARVYRTDNYMHDQILFQQRRKQWLTQVTEQ